MAKRKCHICNASTGSAGARKCKHCGHWQCPECALDAATRAPFDDGWCVKCNGTWAADQRGSRGPRKAKVACFGVWVFAEPVRAWMVPGAEPRTETKHRRGRVPGTAERQYNGRAG